MSAAAMRVTKIDAGSYEVTNGRLSATVFLNRGILKGPQWEICHAWDNTVFKGPFHTMRGAVAQAKKMIAERVAQ